MNVFILSTGRCGSTTLTRAFDHATNFTSGHETLSHLIHGRLAYPDDHIESDNRLAWFLGSLHCAYGDAAHWVHLTRDRDAVVNSLASRWERQIATRRPARLIRHPRRSLLWFREWTQDPASRFRPSIAAAFGYGVVESRAPLNERERRDACALYVETVNANIAHFLRDKTHVHHIALEDVHHGFTAVWNAIGAQGDVPAALTELDVRHNSYP